MKTSCFKRTLAILLSVLLATPLFVLSAFADGYEGFNSLTTDTTDCESGDTWYNRAALADATGVEAYEKASFYLSEDGNTLKISYRDADDNSVTEEYARDTDPQYFDYICVLPAFGDPLPLSDEGLADGDYWYDVAGLTALLEAIGEDEDMITMISGATFRLSADGEILRMTISVSGSAFHQDEFTAQPDVLCGYLRQVGVEPVMEYEGFTQLPTSEDGLEDGAYWFDATALAQAEEAIFAQALYYLSDDGDTLRIVVVGTIIDVSRAEEPEVFSFLRQVGVDPNAGFTLLPTSDEGLEDGDYWFDAAGLAATIDNEAYLTYQYYLSEDGNTLRIVSGITSDYAKDDVDGAAFFAYLHQAGVDPNAGFTQLPTSAEGLSDGAYWFDAAGLAATIDNEAYLTYQYYLSDDGNTLRINAGIMLEYTRDDADSAAFFAYLHQVGVDPNAGFTQLPTSAEGLSDGAYWFDAAGLAATIDNEDYLTYQYYLSDDGNTLRIVSGTTLDFAKDDVDDAAFFAYLHQVGVDPNAGFTQLPTSADGLEDGEQWYDAAGLAAFIEEDYFAQADYYISADGTLLRICLMGESLDFAKGDGEDSSLVFSFLRTVGEDLAAGFVLLPKSPDGLNDGDWWFDAAGLAATEEDEADQQADLAASYYLSEDGQTLRIVMDSFYLDIALDDEQMAHVIAFLKQVGTVDPNEGFTQLPTSDEGLADGAYWFDLAGLVEATEEEALLDAQVYLRADGNLLRFVVEDETLDFDADDTDNDFVFSFLKQAGGTPVDPDAYALLPTSDEGLADGEYWFDLAGYAAFLGDSAYLNAQAYLRGDGKMLRIVLEDTVLEYPKDKANSDYYYRYLHQVGDEVGEATLTVSAPTDPVHRGQTFTVTVDLAQNPGLAGMTLSLDYNPNVLTLTDVQTAGMLETGNLTLGGDLNVQPYNVLWDDATAHENHTETGTILVLTFTVKNTAAAGETIVTLTYDADSTFDVDLQNVPVVVSGAVLTIDPRLPGDVDGDGELDLADVVALTRYLAGGWGVTVQEDNCDVNGDNEIDLRDVILMRRFLAGGWDVELI